MKVPFILTVVFSSLVGVAVAADTPHPIQDPQVAVVLTAVSDCHPECAVKQYEDFKSNLEDTFDQHSGCEEKFKMNLKQKHLDTKSWYSRECIIQCLGVVRKEFADNEDVKGQVGGGAFGFWASKGAITAVEEICAR